jgi:hypothetical protein
LILESRSGDITAIEAAATVDARDYPGPREAVEVGSEIAAREHHAERNLSLRVGALSRPPT